MAAKRAGTLRAGVAGREAWAWAMYDFANSGYTTVVVTAIFNAYFVASVAGNADWASLAWSGALAVSYALIMLTAPAVGAYADLKLAKKRLLALTTLGCVAGTAALSLVGPGEILLGVVIIVVSNFFFGTGENLIAAFLPELARPRGMGRLSGWGWGLGYVGGLLTLAVCLAYVSHAQGQGLGADDFVPATLWITAIIFLLASLPAFLFLRERGGEQAADNHPVKGAYRQVLDTLAHARHFPDLFRFLGCIVFYQAGVQAVIALAAIYAQQAMHFDTRQTIILVMVVNITAAVGALAFGHVQDRIGHKRAVAITLLGWLLTVLLAWQATDAGRFWLAANVAGLCLGASQSAGRALVGYLSPHPHRAEFFGLWGLAVKLSSILGPVTYGLAAWLSGGDHRLAMLSLGVYFLAGLTILGWVDVGRGRRRALRKQDLKNHVAIGATVG
ncbi:MAG: MFS transporter [Chromatiaceae bacterium]|nr:MFS transporter [Candidatus Thioaporhodococcus sediminis]